MGRRLLITFTVFSAICWFLILFSISFFMFYWRTENEPGISGSLTILTAARILLGTGILGTVFINAIFIKFREKKIWIAWIANIAATIIYSPVFILTLLMMV